MMRMMFYTLMMKSMELNNINYKKFETQLLNIYPHLSKEEAEIMIKQLFKYWGDIIDNLDKLKK